MPIMALPSASKSDSVAGVRTTYGSPIFAEHVPLKSDILVETLEASGGINEQTLRTIAETGARRVIATHGNTDALIRFLRERDIHAVFHYVPLHDSPAGLRYSRSVGELPVTCDVAQRLVRLPLYSDMSARQVAQVCAAVAQFFAESRAV